MSNINNINNDITNQENDTNFNLVNTNNNVNNQNEEETNRNDSNLKPPIYWNDQNEEAFLQEIELQNLFANTLLHDDFNNDETDFNCLGIDNLQLNYTNESSNDQQQPIQTSTTTPTNSLNDTNVLSSLSLISLNNSTTPTDHQLNQNSNDFILRTTFNTFNTIDVSNLINEPPPSENTILDLNTLQILDSTVAIVRPTSAITTSSSSSNLSSATTTTTTSTSFKPDLINTSNESIQTTSLLNQDDSLFKKPNLFESFFTVASLTNNNNNNTNSTVNSSRNSSSSSTTSTTRRSTNLPNDLTKFNTKPKLKQQQKQIVNLLEPMDLITQLKKMNNFREDSTKSKSKDDDSKSEFNLSISKNDNAFTSNSIIGTSSSPINKLFTLKRSRKRSKLITNSSSSSNKLSSTTNLSNQDTNTTSTTSNHQAKTNIKLTKSTKTSKKEKKEKLKQIKLNTVNLEPLNKKLAVDKLSIDINSNSSNSSLIKLKKEDVELHIKELSLLDLHSSEDDSSELLIKNVLNSNLKKNVRSSSNDNNTNISINSINNSFTTNTTTVKNSNYLNEILSKRIKYSPVLNSSSNLNKPEQTVEFQSITNSVNTVQDLNNNTNKKERKIDKLIQYLTKSSLDSNGNSVSSSTSSSESLQLVKKLTNQDINDNQSPPAISQNKRKKNEIDLISLPITINENVIHSVNSDESSKSIDNDTLQHMKNLDLNLDLLPNETTFKKNKHSVIREELVVEQKQTHNANESTNLTIDLKDINSRKMLWNMLKSNSSLDEMIEEFGVELHDKISFWDLVKLKLKFSKNSQLKTTYDIIDDYTILYSNMSDLLESFVEEHSSTKSITFKKNENSSRSRSSSRNCRKQSSTAPLHRI